jgi:hypothetical protein
MRRGAIKLLIGTAIAQAQQHFQLVRGDPLLNLLTHAILAWKKLMLIACCPI